MTSEKKRIKQVERRQQEVFYRDYQFQNDEQFELLNMELEKRRDKYTILTNDQKKNYQNTKLLKSIDDKMSNANHRRNENIQKLEKRFSLRREYEKLK